MAHVTTAPGPHAEMAQLKMELAAVRAELDELRSRPAAGHDSALLQRVFSDQLLLEHLPAFVCLLDRDQRILFLNRTVPGRRVDTLLGLRAEIFIAPEHRERYIEAFERAWSSCEPQTIEYTSVSGRSWTTRLVPIRHEGAVQHVVAASLDVSERLLEQKALREHHARLRHAIDLVGMGTWTRHWDTDTLGWDDALCAIFGVSKTDPPASYEQFLQYVHPDDRERIVAYSARSRELGEYPEFEYRIVRPSGEVRHVRAKGSLLYDADGIAVGTLGALFDVTDRRRLEEQSHQRQKMEAIGQLTAGIAHNFNNLLSIVVPNLELCIEEATPEVKEHLEDVQHAALRAADLVRQLMLFARRDTTDGRVTVDPIATVQRMVAICRTTFDRSIRIDVEIGADLPHIVANPGLLEQVLLNVCLNARDALAEAETPSPRITIALERASSGALRIRVSDNGPGMDEQTRARAFEPFFTSKEVGRGTGLGLATVYAIVRDHDGRVSCESSPGCGATFEIELPPAPAPARAVEPSPPRATPLSGQETILVIDDEELVRRATRSMLARYGYRVLGSRDGDEALALFESPKVAIDLVILDRSMPGLSGERVLNKLQELAPGVPIVLLSGQSFDARLAKSAAAALIKPVDTQGLLGTIRRLLDGRAASAV